MSIMSPRKNIIPKSLKPNSSKAPGKTVLPRNKYQQKSTHHRNNITQRRFSLIDSDSSELSEFDSNDEDDDDDDDDEELRKSSTYGNKFTAIESSSDDESATESSNEEIWKSNAKRVVNTSSEEEDEEDSSSSDDEDIDFVRLTAERKARSLENYRSASPFKSPIKEPPLSQDVDFSFDFNNNDHQLKIVNEEEDLGEAIDDGISPLKADAHPISGEPLGFMDIEDSDDSDNDINKDELLKAIEQDSDGIDTGIETGDEEYNLLKQEADNIAQEYDEDGLQLSSTNVTPRNSVVEDMIRKHKSEMANEEVLQYVSGDEYDSEDDYDEDHDDEFAIPYFDDGFLKSQEANQIVNNKANELDSDDDTYLWDYFFSSGDENDDEGQNASQSNNYSDDESTDEDETLPPPSSRKKIGSKAQELLSSSSITARPPALGTWSTDSKPFGIIDGLSTRSLLPTKLAGTASIGSSSVSMIPMTPSPNNIEELALDELLNISELEDDEHANAEWLEVTASDRKVPLSAFRNKGVINNEHSHINATRRFSLSRENNSPSNNMRKASKKKQRFNEVTMTPIRTLSQTKGKKKVSKRRRQSMTEAAVEGFRVTRSGLFSEDTLTNVEEFLSGLGNDTELSILFREVQ